MTTPLEEGILLILLVGVFSLTIIAAVSFITRRWK